MLVMRSARTAGIVPDQISSCSWLIKKDLNLGRSKHKYRQYIARFSSLFAYICHAVVSHSILLPSQDVSSGVVDFFFCSTLGALNFKEVLNVID